MQAAVARERELTSASTKKMPVWDAIAKECISRSASGHSALGKLKALLRVYRDKSRRETLSPLLLKLLKQYTQFMEAPQGQDGDDDEHVTMKEVVDDELAKSSGSGKQEKRPSVKAHRVAEVTITEEEEMMAIVLKHAPKFKTATDETHVWDAIARESSGRFENGVATRHHYAGLMRWLNPALYKHKVLTPMLRLQLQQLQDSDYSVPLEKSDTTKPATKKAAVVSERVVASESSGASATPDANDAEEKAVPLRPPTSKEDSWLLYEIIRIRPFDHKGEGFPYWEQVVAALNERIGSADVFPNQKVCQRRMSKLLNAVRRPLHPSTPLVTPLQLEILTVLLEIMELKYQWGAIMRLKTDEYYRIESQLTTLLQKAKPKPAGSTKPASSMPVTRPALGERPALPVAKKASTPSAQVGNRASREDDEERKENEPTPKVPRASVSSSNVEEPPTASLQTQSVQNVLSSATNVDSSSAQAIALELERERRDHVQAFQTMVQVLQADRDKIQRETDAILARVEKQRADRKEEFKTMINLVAHAAAQYRA